MSGAKSPQSGLTRRSFLKTTAAVAGATAALGSAGAMTALGSSTENEEAASKSGFFINSCRSNCGGKCSINVEVRNGKVVRVLPAAFPEEDKLFERICVKGLSQPQRVYDPDRLKYPMRRVEGTERGDGQWERISWDDAIAEIADNFNRILKEHGGSSLAMWTGYGSQGFLNGSDVHGTVNVGYGRFTTHLGMTSFDSTADWAGIYGAMCMGMYSAGCTQDTIGSKIIICIGADPAEALQGEWIFVKEAMMQGAKLVTIDPRFSNTAARSDYFLPIIPGTDAILLMAWCNYIIDNDLINMDYLVKASTAPFLVKEDGNYLYMSELGGEPIMVTNAYGMQVPYDPPVVWDLDSNSHNSIDLVANPAVFGEYEVNGMKVKTTLQIAREAIKGYTMERAAEECGLDLETITEIIDIYAKGPASLISYNGMAHHSNSHHTYKALALMVALTGNNGQKGRACLAGGSWRSYFTTDSAVCSAPNPKPVLKFPGMLLPQAMKTGKIYDIEVNPKAVWFVNGNPLCNESGRVELMEAVKQLEFIVCSDSVMTDTARYADIILPICHPFEQNDMESASSAGKTGYFHPIAKAIEPLYECKSDMDIFRDLATAMGFPELFDKTDEEYISAMMDTPVLEMFGLSSKGIMDAARRGECVRCPIDFAFTDVQNYTSQLTSSGRIEFYWANPTPRYYYGQNIDVDLERVPCHIYPTEAYLHNPDREKYPLLGNSSHSRFSAHSQQAHTPLIRELQPEPVVKLNPIDAEARGISTGDIVRVYNQRGYVVIKAEVSEGIQPNTMYIRQSWQLDHFIDGHAQDLTDVRMNEFCWNSNFYDFLCEIEKCS